MGVPKIITENLTLREIKSKDMFEIIELFSDIETMDLFGKPPITNDIDINNFIEHCKRDFERDRSILWAITLTEEKEFIGFIRLMSYKSDYFDSSYSSMGESRNNPEFLNEIDRSGWEIDYALLKKYWSRGIMSEALKSILKYAFENNISPLYAKVNSLENSATINLLKKCKFNKHIPMANRKGGYGMIFRKLN